MGAALPPRRDAARVEAAAAAPTSLDGGADSIIVPAARDRMLELIEREQLPGDVRLTLAGALGGDLRRQLLFQAMIDTWPRLQKAIREVKLAAHKAPWRVVAWAPRARKPQSRRQPRLASGGWSTLSGRVPVPAGSLQRLSVARFRIAFLFLVVSYLRASSPPLRAMAGARRLLIFDLVALGEANPPFKLRSEINNPQSAIQRGYWG